MPLIGSGSGTPRDSDAIGCRSRAREAPKGEAERARRRTQRGPLANLVARDGSVVDCAYIRVAGSRLATQLIAPRDAPVEVVHARCWVARAAAPMRLRTSCTQPPLRQRLSAAKTARNLILGSLLPLEQAHRNSPNHCSRDPIHSRRGMLARLCVKDPVWRPGSPLPGGGASRRAATTQASHWPCSQTPHGRVPGAPAGGRCRAAGEAIPC